MHEDSGKRVDKPGAGKWYELFSRGARDWLRHNEKVREAVREQPAGDHRRRRRDQRRARAPCACRCACSSTTTSGCASPRSSRAPARARPSPATCSRDPSAAAGPGREGRGRPATMAASQLLLEFKVDDIVDWLWEEMQLPNLKARAGPSEESDWVREGWDRRGARSRLDRRRSFKELVKRRGTPGATPTFTDDDLRFRQLARRRQPAVHAVVFFMLDVSGEHVRPRPQARQDLLLLGGAGPAARVPLARDRVRRAHHRGVGIQRGGVLPGERQRRHGGFRRPSARCARSSTRATTPARSNIYLFYASDGDNAVSDDRRGRARRWPPMTADTLLQRLRGGLLGRVATAGHRDRPPVRGARSRRLRRRQLRAQRLR